MIRHINLDEILNSFHSGEKKVIQQSCIEKNVELTLREKDAIELDVVGILDGGDKASIRGVIPCAWDYYRHYSEAFGAFRNENINVFEIGVSSGSSLKTWASYFKSATLVGIDIDPTCKRFECGPIKVRIGSQDDEEFLQAVANEYLPTIVIDDGSHQAQHIIKSFEILFSLILPGGIYAVEDLAFHFAAQGEEVVPVTHGWGTPVFSYFVRFMAAKAAHVTVLDGAPPELNKIYSEIDQITIAGGLIIVCKKKIAKWEKHIPIFEKQLRERAQFGSDHYSECALRYAEFLLTYNINLPRAIELLKDTLLTRPGYPNIAIYLIFALKASSQDVEAQQIAEENGLKVDDVHLPAVHYPVWMKFPH
ncbi:hypothetical protein [Labrys neptuniae]